MYMISINAGTQDQTTEVNKFKYVIEHVLTSYDDSLNSLPKKALPSLANHLYEVSLINSTVKEEPSMEEFVEEFKASLKFKKTLPQIQEHCQKFLNSFVAVRGSYAAAAVALSEQWVKAVRTELGYQFNIDISHLL